MTGLQEVFRATWPVVVASTARFTRDLDLAEDCAQEAVERALRSWPGGAGVPDNPAGWLTTTARRIALDRLRREATLRRTLPLLVEPPHTDDGDVEPTDPLRLVFTCCRPALARESQVALTLRLVCGVDVAAIAAALLTGEAGVARRITRAKGKIAAARVPFRVPPDDELPARLDTVLTVVHLVYTAGHVGPGSGARDTGPLDTGLRDTEPRESEPRESRPRDTGPRDIGPREFGLRDTELTGRAIELARMLAALLPGESEPRALLGLMLLTEARGSARTGGDGELVLLPTRTGPAGTVGSSERGWRWSPRRCAPGRTDASRCRRASRACTPSHRAGRRPTGRRS